MSGENYVPLSNPDEWLVAQVRQGETKAWEDLVQRFQGRLFAFIQSRLKDHALAEDLVQETFLGLWNSLPNYDARRPLESFLFAIAGHKIVDQLRKQGRKAGEFGSGSENPVPEYADLKARVASSIARSAEQHSRESEELRRTLQELIGGWIQNGEWERLKCSELLLVKGWANREVAQALGISEQGVANHKYFLIQQLKRKCESGG